MQKTLKIILMLFPVLACSYGFSQPGGTVRIEVVAGGDVPFVFNSIEKYNNGFSYSNWTVFTLTVVDIGNDDLPGSWKLDFQAQTANINGDGGNIILLPPAVGNLQPVQLTASVVGAGFGGGGNPTPWGVSTYGPLELRGDIAQTIADDRPPVSTLLATEEPTTDCAPPVCFDQIAITYDCGVVNPLLGQPADYYTVDILFTFEVTF